MKPINERLDILLLSLFKSKTAAAKRFGVSRGYISNLTTGGKPVRGDFLEKIAEVLPMVNIDWLYHGRGTMLYQGEDSEKISGVEEPVGKYAAGAADNAADIAAMDAAIMELRASVEALRLRMDSIKRRE